MGGRDSFVNSQFESAVKAAAAAANSLRKKAKSLYPSFLFVDGSFQVSVTHIQQNRNDIGIEMYYDETDETKRLKIAGIEELI